ncbi:hypothetical protein HDV05_008683 [Chytridiales sp. JEL 0842]|nr:hypothetical protein HDV05_008683 [Chytridiales sp. JEL 0842]
MFPRLLRLSRSVKPPILSAHTRRALFSTLNSSSSSSYSYSSSNSSSSSSSSSSYSSSATTPFTFFLTPTLLLLLVLSPATKPPLECSPTYNGVPVAASFLMHQAHPHFEKQFPGLEMSAVFISRDPKFRPLKRDGTQDERKEEEWEREYVYVEKGLSFWPTGAHVEVPIFERLSEVEEARLGNAGIRKGSVGRLVLEGECGYGCASVKLKEMRVEKLDGTVVWSKRFD